MPYCTSRNQEVVLLGSWGGMGFGDDSIVQSWTSQCDNWDASAFSSLDRKVTCSVVALFLNTFFHLKSRNIGTCTVDYAICVLDFFLYVLNNLPISAGLPQIWMGTAFLVLLQLRRGLSLVVMPPSSKNPH